ncbi:MAG: sensory transduction histidine kinase [Clostridiaceae bacterium]|jgi:signal transduction histidine kinase|nr:sensory transduction histidine kinase [Clostridiaceae bacterium]
MKLKIIKSAKISVKLTMIYAFMFSLVLLLLSASILYGIKYYLNITAAKQVEDVKAMILNQNTSVNESADLSKRDILLDFPTKEGMFIRIYDKNGIIINSSDNFNYKINISEPYNKVIHIEDEGKHITYVNVKASNIKYGTAYIQIVKDMNREYTFLKILFAFMAVGDLIGIIASIIFGYLVSKRMLMPIDYITKTAENIGAKNLKERIDIKGPDDELKRLADTFNKMIDRLQGAFDKQTQFVSDASHELRTPIAVIQGYANLLDRWGKDDRDALEKSIYAIKLETNNMASLVEKLLFLAKGDSGTKRIEKKEFYLNQLVDEVVEESKLIAENHFISNSSNDTVKIFADYEMIKQMLRIFIDNSMKFTNEGGNIDISSIAIDNSVKITISDTGMGIPKNEIQNIFNRFYTVDKSRSKEKTGTGLGLSIAKWIADIHEGTIGVESEDEKGTRITVTLKKLK